MHPEKRDVEKKTFHLPTTTSKRLKLSAALTGHYEREIVDQAINRYLDELGIPKNLPYQKK